MWRGLSFEGLVSIAVPGQNLNPVQKDSLVYVASSQFRRPGQHSWARPKPQPSIKTLSRICGEASVSKGLVNVAGAWNQSWPQYKKTLSYMCGGCICRRAPWLERLSPVSGAGLITRAMLPGQATAERFVFEFAKPAKPMKSKPSTFQNQWKPL